LVEIYGESWKRHYDISGRCSRNPLSSKDLNQIRSLCKRERVGLAVPPKSQYVIDVNLFARKLLKGLMSPSDPPPMCIEKLSMRFEKQLPGADNLSDTNISFENLESSALETKSPRFDKEITCYTQLYSNSGSDDEVMTKVSPDKEITCYSQLYPSSCSTGSNADGAELVSPMDVQSSGYQSTLSHSPKFHRALSNSDSQQHEEMKRNLFDHYSGWVFERSEYQSTRRS